MRELLTASLLMIAGACGDDAGARAAPETTTEADCPPGAVSDPARAQRVYDQLRSIPEGADVLAALDGIEPPICFGASEPSVVTSDGQLWLDSRMGDPEAAARTAHLLHHLGAMPDLDHPAPGEGCDALVAEAMRVERQALALEERLRVELGVANPVTDPRTDGLEAAYRARCEAHSAGDDADG